MLSCFAGGCQPQKENNTEKPEEKPFVYDYGFHEQVMPFWQSDVIYNEPVLLLEETPGGVSSGKLMLEPAEIYSVRDYSLKREWKRGVDWEYRDGKIVRLDGSDIPYFTEENLHGRDLMRRSYGENGEIIREPFGVENPTFQTVSGEDTVIYTETPLIFEYQIFVTYKYKEGSYKGPVQPYLGDKLPLLEQKIRTGEDIRMLLLGDSISCGGCSSSNINSEPFMKNWYELFADAVAEASGGNVKMDNSYSVGGQISDWSLSSSGESVNGVSLNKAQAAVLKEKPDLILIGWGMNDGTWHENQDLLAENVLKIIDSITFVYKEPVEFIVIGTCMPNDNGACYVLDSGVRKPLYGFQPTYSASLAEMCASVDNAVFVDAGEIHRYAIANKKYEDMTVNNVNHPNDFVIRIYAMNLSSAVIRDFGKQGQG